MDESEEKAKYNAGHVRRAARGLGLLLSARVVSARGARGAGGGPWLPRARPRGSRRRVGGAAVLQGGEGRWRAAHRGGRAEPRRRGSVAPARGRPARLSGPVPPHHAHEGRGAERRGAAAARMAAETAGRAASSVASSPCPASKPSAPLPTPIAWPGSSPPSARTASSLIRSAIGGGSRRPPRRSCGSWRRPWGSGPWPPTGSAMPRPAAGRSRTSSPASARRRPWPTPAGSSARTPSGTSSPRRRWPRSSPTGRTSCATRRSWPSG